MFQNTENFYLSKIPHRLSIDQVYKFVQSGSQY